MKALLFRYALLFGFVELIIATTFVFNVLKYDNNEKNLGILGLISNYLVQEHISLSIFLASLFLLACISLPRINSYDTRTAKAKNYLKGSLLFLFAGCSLSILMGSIVFLQKNKGFSSGSLGILVVVSFIYFLFEMINKNHKISIPALKDDRILFVILLFGGLFVFLVGILFIAL